MTHHPHPAAVAAAEKIYHSFDCTQGGVGKATFTAITTPIISDAITAALSAPSPVGAGDTPRTDEATHHLCGGGEVLSMQRYNHGDWVPADFARQLERELAEWKAKADLCWGSANYRLKYIFHLFRALGWSEENMEGRISEASEYITALREQVRALGEDKVES